MNQKYDPNPPGRVLRQDITFPTGSYSTESRIDLNPWDFAYRSPTKVEYYKDVILFALYLTPASYGGNIIRRGINAAELIFGD